ncbi:sugar kinase [mine drainage metagenome]|uniref:Sugar kinase n=2 Tax=mine drainage metagenome TaxID=410659 RepID=T1BPP0_9ZZZZ
MILVSGSLAFDTVMRYGGRFADQILPGHLETLSVAFEVGELRRDFGGCAGNICYSLGLLGESACPWGAVGRDFGPYRSWLEERGISTVALHPVETLTAQAYIMTDRDDNQITAFHPGAMLASGQAPFPAVLEKQVRIGVVAPDSREGMRAHARDFRARSVPYLFDPGQALGILSAEDVYEITTGAGVVAVNDYEAGLLGKRFGFTIQNLLEQVGVVVQTRGREGSWIWTRTTDRVEIPPVVPAAEIDPTGCGDAYRAGLLWGWVRGLDWAVTGRVASLLGAFKIECAGTQNHGFQPAEFWSRYRSAFALTPPEFSRTRELPA